MPDTDIEGVSKAADGRGEAAVDDKLPYEGRLLKVCSLRVNPGPNGDADLDCELEYATKEEKDALLLMLPREPDWEGKDRTFPSEPKAEPKLADADAENGVCCCCCWALVLLRRPV